MTTINSIQDAHLKKKSIDLFLRLGVLAVFCLQLASCSLYQSDDRKCLEETVCVSEVGNIVAQSIECESNSFRQILESRGWKPTEIALNSTTMKISEPSDGENLSVLIYQSGNLDQSLNYCLYEDVAGFAENNRAVAVKLENKALKIWSDQGPETQ